MLNVYFDVRLNANTTKISMDTFENNNISGHQPKTKFDRVLYIDSKGNFLIYTPNTCTRACLQMAFCRSSRVNKSIEGAH